MRAAGIVVVAVVVAVLLGMAQSARADKIVFWRIEDRTERMWVMRSDGSAERRLPRFGVSDTWDLSSDGRRLLWTANDGKLWSATLTGQRRRLVSRAGGAMPRSSPSGGQIAMVRSTKPPTDWTGEFTQIFVVRPGHHRARQLRIPGVHMAGPSWSPDGRRIVAVGYRQQHTCTPPPMWPPVCQTTFTHGLWIINVASGAAREIPQDAPTGAAAWSPDGRTIAFSRHPDRGEPGQLWLIRPDGSELRQLTNLPGGAEGPSWSPNGRRLALVTEPRGDGSDVATIRADGSGLRILTHRGNNSDPDWSR
jgi:Tol biopolymer transport system component